MSEYYSFDSTRGLPRGEGANEPPPRNFTSGHDTPSGLALGGWYHADVPADVMEQLSVIAAKRAEGGSFPSYDAAWEYTLDEYKSLAGGTPANTWTKAHDVVKGKLTSTEGTASPVEAVHQQHLAEIGERRQLAGGKAYLTAEAVRRRSLEKPPQPEYHRDLPASATGEHRRPVAGPEAGETSYAADELPAWRPAECYAGGVPGCESYAQYCERTAARRLRTELGMEEEWWPNPAE
jgi:hypothetical protein